MLPQRYSAGDPLSTTRTGGFFRVIRSFSMLATASGDSPLLTGSRSNFR
ncbi:MAG TPA: hypothetical protein PLU53_07735 [Bacteroidia bacterium]|nr:hypothetical protein [Bacteroidia bacterium]